MRLRPHGARPDGELVTPPSPLPPGDLARPFRALWTKTRQALEKQGTWQDSDAELLSRYIRALERASLAHADLLKDPETGEPYADGRPRLTALGSNKQIVQHPSVKTAREAEQDADARARMLLLSPEARKRVDLKPPSDGDGGKFGLN